MKLLLIALLLTGCVKKEVNNDPNKLTLREFIENRGLPNSQKSLDDRNDRCIKLCKPYAPAYFSPTSSECLCMAGDKE